MTQRPASLIGFANLFKHELQIDGNMNDIIDQSSVQLGIMNDSDTVMERANRCYDQLFSFNNRADSNDPFDGKQELTHFAYGSFSELELISCRWQAGTDGSGASAYICNPWVFNADHRFVTQRDGCSGVWALTQRVHPLTGVPVVKLRLDWQGEKNVNWAEFMMNHPNIPQPQPQSQPQSQPQGAATASLVEEGMYHTVEANPLFSCTGSSYRHMRSWNLRKTVPGSVVDTKLLLHDSHCDVAVGTCILSAEFLDHISSYSKRCGQLCGFGINWFSPWIFPIVGVTGLLALLLYIVMAFVQHSS